MDPSNIQTHTGEADLTSKNAARSLKEITAVTVRPIMKLTAAENQKHFIAPNANSIAEVYFSKEAWFRGIYSGDDPVDFVMLHTDKNKPVYFLRRLMTDQAHQGKGCGLQAVKKVIVYVNPPQEPMNR